MFKKYLIAGLLFWVPLVVTMVSIDLLVDMLTSVFSLLPFSLHPDVWIGFHIPGIELVMLIFIVWLSGLLVANFLGRKAIAYGERLVERLPLVRSIYSGVKQIMKMMVKSDSTAFRQVVLISFPQKGSWVVGLVTQVVEYKNKQASLTVFVPTTPNPTSGYVITVDQKEAIVLDMTVDEALKYIISLGTLSHDALNNAYCRLFLGE
jgi:uncharacterized membrane protein